MRGVWATDSTEAGTRLLVPGLEFDKRTTPEIIRDYTYFSGSRALWRTDGTTAVTTEVTKITPVNGSTILQAANSMFELNGYVYFRTNDSFHGDELWRVPVDPLPGDADGDGVVEFADFLLLSANFGNEDVDAYFSDGDFNGDGRIDFSDFLILSASFGSSI